MITIGRTKVKQQDGDGLLRRLEECDDEQQWASVLKTMKIHKIVSTSELANVLIFFIKMTRLISTD
jgi:hypothetical protein